MKGLERKLEHYTFEVDQITRGGITFERVNDQLYRWEGRYFVKQWYAKRPYEYLEYNKVLNTVKTIYL